MDKNKGNNNKKQPWQIIKKLQPNLDFATDTNLNLRVSEEMGSVELYKL